MSRIDETLGGHEDLPTGALTKQEVAALLCKAGLEAGLWSVPEFEVVGDDGVRRKIDVVWATRCRGADGELWRPFAAFEIEGHDVAHASTRKNAHSLFAIAESVTVRAIVLFQVGPKGEPWHSLAVPDCIERARSCLAEALLPDRGRASQVEILMDEDLGKWLDAWTKQARIYAAAAAS
jgi:hypothetical protein